jgi:putative hydrolase of the HAD superfamily
MQPIKNIIFDLGGVFMNLDFSLTEQAFAELGVQRFPEMFNQHHSNDLFEQLETGKISPEAFYDAFRKEAGIDRSNEQIENAWNALLLDFPQERLNWLKAISGKYRIYLFSNTNQIHYDAFMEVLRVENNCTDFNDYFLKAYYSHELGLRKPYASTFKKILELENLSAAETLFIDDTFKNIEGAKEAGLQTYHLVAPETVLDLTL